jgi:hypothetical protein
VSSGFHPEARREFVEVYEHYEACREGLGRDFYFEVHHAISRIRQFPKRWPVIEGEVRRGLIRRFPYGVVYTIEQDDIVVVAVGHLHRDPDYWKHRLQS